MENNDVNRVSEKKNGIKKYIPLIAVITIVILIGLFWYKEYSKYISTDDAHVDSDNVSISSKIMGRISHLYADEGDSVKNGMLLAELDSSDLLSQKRQDIAAENKEIAGQMQAEADDEVQQEKIKVAEISLEKTQDDFNRAKEQFAGQVISKEKFDQIQKAYETAKAQLELEKTQLNSSKVKITSAMASVESAKAKLAIEETNLNNTRIYAPFDGIVAKRWLLPGDIAQPGQSIFTLTNSKKLWVAVYLEETKVTKIHLNQKAQFTLDAFPGTKFTGKVFSIGSNTESQFSLIPPNNASGNFTKVTQRVPVKISIDGTDGNGSPAEYKILSGMSAVIKIIKD